MADDSRGPTPQVRRTRARRARRPTVRIHLVNQEIDLLVGRSRSASPLGGTRPCQQHRARQRPPRRSDEGLVPGFGGLRAVGRDPTSPPFEAMPKEEKRRDGRQARIRSAATATSMLSGTRSARIATATGAATPPITAPSASLRASPAIPSWDMRSATSVKPINKAPV